MKTSLKYLTLVTLCAGSLLTLPVGCAGTSTKQSTGEYVDDAAITAKVKKALISDPVVKAGEVNVETFKGTVQLSGFVDTSEQKSRAAEVAGAVAGVRDVKNNINVK